MDFMLRLTQRVKKNDMYRSRITEQSKARELWDRTFRRYKKSPAG